MTILATIPLVYECVNGEAFAPYLNGTFNIYITGHSLGGYLSQMCYKYIKQYKPNVNVVRVDTFNAVGIQSAQNVDIPNPEKVTNYYICCDIAKNWSEDTGLVWIGNRIQYDIHTGTSKGHAWATDSGTQIDAHSMNWFLQNVSNPLCYIVAKPTTAAVYVDGIETPFDAYLIGENNYFKLRDIAYALNDKFNVTWNSQYVTITKNQKYNSDENEDKSVLKPSNKVEKHTRTPDSSLVVLVQIPPSTSMSASLSTYYIDEYNYVKLRDTAKLINFDVDWRDGKTWIESNNPYTDD